MKQIFHRWLPLLLLLGLLLLFFTFHFNSYLSYDSLRTHSAWLTAQVQAYPLLVALLFVLTYVIAVAASFPGALFLTMAGGFLFGIAWGAVLVVFSASLGALLIFFAIRMALADWLAARASGWVDRMRQGFQTNAFSYLLTLRLIPVFPFWVVNMVPAMLGVSARTFFVATFLGIIPGSLVYAMLGDSLHAVFAADQKPDLGIIFTPGVLIPLLALAALSLLPVLYRRIRNSSKGSIYDVAILGAGSAGLSVAAVAAQLGLKVVLIESEKMGGECLNSGCVPSKSLLAAAKSVHALRNASSFGVLVDEYCIDFSRVMRQVQGVIANLAEHDSVARFESLGVRVIQAAARFSDAKTVMAGDVAIAARRFVIATGSSPSIPPIDGLQQVPYLTNETVFELSVQPEHLIIIGGGPVGCELGQAFALLGSRVTVLEAATILPKDDADCVAIVREELLACGMMIYEHTQIEQVAYGPEEVISVCVRRAEQTETLFGTHLLVAAGRRPNVAGLGLEWAGVEYSRKGIAVNSRMQTTNKKVYALGDVVGVWPLTHMASYQAGIVLRNIAFRLPARADYRAVPWVTYTEPEIAHVGVFDGIVTEWLYAGNDRAQIERSPKGKIKVLTDKKGRVLGATIVGAHAGELILPWVMAVRERKTLRSFTDVIVPYPTVSEISKRVAGEFYRPRLFSDKTRKLVSWLKLL